MTDPDRASIVGADIGGSTVDVVVLDGSSEVVASATRTTSTDDPEQILASAVGAIGAALDEAAVTPGELEAIGVGVPGQVDPVAGSVRLAMNLSIGEEGFPIGPKIEAEFGVRTAIENDVRAAALGAWQTLDVGGVETLAYVGIGTGISAGVVCGGRLHRGRNGMAGELGHFRVSETGPPCRCGSNGCIEVMAAGPAIERSWPSGRGRSAEDLFTSAMEGDPEAVAKAGAIAGYLGEAVQLVVFAYDPDLVVLGGGVGSLGDPLLSAIKESLAEAARRSHLVRHVIDAERLISMPKGVAIGAIGAAAVARQRFGGDGGVAHPA